MIFEQIANGGDRNLGYLIADESTRIAGAVDPSYAPERYLERSKETGLDLRYVICTHSHHDHVNGNDYLIEHAGVEVVMFRDAEYFFDITVEDGEIFKVGNLSLKIIHT
ncbi:uncharacterized protein METZ01_LOCUS294992, partial [marine metagenome]